jgi:hypothetical protein
MLLDIKDLIELFGAVKDVKDDLDINGFGRALARSKSSNNQSVSNMARNNICQYPLLVSTSITLESYTELASQLEKLYATNLKMAIACNIDRINLDKDETRQNILHKFHQNDNVMTHMSGMTDIDGNTLDEIVFESFRPYVGLSERAVKTANKELLIPYSENFNDDNLNSIVSLQHTSNYLDEDSTVLSEATFDPKDPNTYPFIYELDNIIDNLMSMLGNTDKYEDPLANKSLAALDKKRRNYVVKCQEIVNKGGNTIDKSIKEEAIRVIERNHQYEVLLTNWRNQIKSDTRKKDGVYQYDINELLNKYENGTITTKEMEWLNKRYDLTHFLEKSGLKNYDIAELKEKYNNKTISDRELKVLQTYWKIKQDFANSGMDEMNYNYLKRKQQSGTISKKELEWLKLYEEIMAKPVAPKRSVNFMDIRKNNELEPYIINMTVNCTFGSTMQSFEFLFGVKTICHPLDANEIIKQIPEVITKRNPLFRFIQWTTGEINTANFVLDFEGQKKAASSKSEVTKWFTHLKARSRVAKERAFTKSLGGKTGSTIIPNATLIISRSDAEYIQIKYKIDLFRNYRQINNLMDTLCLMYFIILDDVNDELMLFNTGTMSYEHYTFSSLKSTINQNIKLNDKLTVNGNKK